MTAAAAAAGAAGDWYETNLPDTDDDDDQPLAAQQARFAAPIDAGTPLLRMAEPQPLTGRGGAFHLWLYQVQSHLMVTKTTGRRAIAYAASHMQGDALTWHYTRFPVGTTASWGEYEAALIAHFTSPQERQQKLDDLHLLRQDRRPLREYIAAFETLTLGLMEVSEEHLLVAFRVGLNDEWKLKMGNLPAQPTTVHELKEALLRLDHTSTKPRAPQRTETTTTTAAYNVLSGNRTTKSLPKLTEELRAQLRAEGRCFRCRERGHLAIDCPAFNQKKASQ